MPCSLAVLIISISFISTAKPQSLNFTFNGFRGSNLTLDGVAEINSRGLLKLTKPSTQRKGHAFYPNLVTFKRTPNDTVSSFSTTFVFAVISDDSDLASDGMAFVISPTTDFSLALPSQFLGLFNSSTTGNNRSHIIAVELDTMYNSEIYDINDNHIGVDINGLSSVSSASAGYFDDLKGKFVSVSLSSEKAMQVWIDYDSKKQEVNVTLAPVKHGKPKDPLLSLHRDLSPDMLDTMYVGFSAGTGSVETSFCVLGWSFQIDGEATPLSPHLPRFKQRKTSKWLTIGLPVILFFLFLLLIIFCCKGDCDLDLQSLLSIVGD